MRNANSRKDDSRICKSITPCKSLAEPRIHCNLFQRTIYLRLLYVMSHLTSYGHIYAASLPSQMASEAQTFVAQEAKRADGNINSKFVGADVITGTFHNWERQAYRLPFPLSSTIPAACSTQYYSQACKATCIGSRAHSKTITPHKSRWQWQSNQIVSLCENFTFTIFQLINTHAT